MKKITWVITQIEINKLVLSWLGNTKELANYSKQMKKIKKNLKKDFGSTQLEN